VEYFRAALNLDANFALAQTGLADAYTLLVDYGLMNPAEGMPKAREAATRAIAIDPGSAEAHSSLALIRGLYDWQWAESELLFHRAIELNPGYATAHHWLAIDCHAPLGRLDEAEAGIEVARQLDPLSSIVREAPALLRVLARDYNGAADLYQKLIGSDPDFYKGYTGLGRARALQGNYLDALRMLDQGLAMAGEIPNILAAMGQVYGLGGEPDRAREMLGRLERIASTGYVPTTAFAIVHLGLGELDVALDWLEKGLERRDMPLTSLLTHPVYDSLRGEPRFRALLTALNFELTDD
jgi:serine/threonine-protein kinase